MLYLILNKLKFVIFDSKINNLLFLFNNFILNSLFFLEVTPRGTKKTFQWQWCKGFSEFEKERIISRISESIVYTHSTSPNEIAKFVQKLLKADLREKSLSVVIGHRKCLGTYVKFDKHLAVYVGNIKVVVFAKKT